MATVAAIILHYWLERTSHIARIVRDLQLGTVAPDKVIVFNNNGSVVLPPMPDVAVVNSTYNFHCLMRHAVGLVTGTDLCLFVDDDVTLQSDGLEYLLRMHETFPGAILGFEGRALGADKSAPYTSGYRVHNVSAPTLVDIVLGRIHFCRTTKLAASFAVRAKLDGVVGSYATDDILLSLSNDEPNIVLPSKMVELGEKGVGCHFDLALHYARRNDVCKEILRYT